MKPVKYIKRFESKTMNAHLILFEDKKRYIVKFHKKGTERTLSNEWIGYHLARYMGLPIPLTKIVEVPEDFIEKTPQLQDDIIATRYQLATSFIANSYNAHDIEVKKIINKEQIAGIIVLDYWLANIDRTRKNVLFTEEERNKHSLWCIDFGDSFTSFAWEREDLNQLPEFIMKSATHKMLASFVKNEEEFRKQLNIIKAIPTLLLEEILSLIPDEWDLSKKDKKQVVKTLLWRRNEVLPGLVEQFIEEAYQRKE